MTVLKSDDYETGDLSKASSTYGAPIVQSTIKYSGTYALALPHFEPSSGRVEYAFIEAPTKIVAEFMFRTDFLPSLLFTSFNLFDLLWFNEEETLFKHFYASAFLLPDPDNLLLGIGIEDTEYYDSISVPFSIDTWYKLKFEIDTAVGTYKMYINDIEVLSFNTPAGYIPDIKLVYFRSTILFETEEYYTYFDDLVITDGAADIKSASKTSINTLQVLMEV